MCDWTHDLMEKLVDLTKGTHVPAISSSGPVTDIEHGLDASDVGGPLVSRDWHWTRSMTVTFQDIAAGKRLAGVLADGEVTVVAIEVHGESSATLTYRTGDGQLGERILTPDDLARDQRGVTSGAGRSTPTVPASGWPRRPVE